MKQRFFALFLTAALLMSLFALPVFAEEVEIAAPSAILIDAATGTVLFEKNADERLAPASVTKVMTLLLVMEALDRGKIGWDDMVSASEHAASKGGSQIYLEPGEQLCMDEMLKSVVVSSANDCATALAEYVAGSESAFVEQMNARALELGMENTHFVNCTGLDDGENADEHLTTARDIALMSRALLAHEDIKKYTTIWTDTVRGGSFGLANTNKLVRFYDGTTGLKTGFTQAAGYCLSASAERDGMELIAVVMHCETSTDRFSSAKALLDYGFANYAAVTPDLDVTVPPVPVTLGTQEAVLPVLSDPAPVLVRKEQAASVRRTLRMETELTAPVAEGQSVGVLTVEADGEVLKEIPLIAPQTVEKLTFGEIYLHFLRKICMG